jgi:VanZ family protein
VSRLGLLGAWAPVALYTSLIWVLSSQALDLPMIQAIPLQDKGVHFLEYAVLGLFMAHAVHSTWPVRALRYLAAIWLTVSLGLVDELHQLYVPGRSADFLDLVADSVGAVVAVLAYAGLRRVLRKGGRVLGENAPSVNQP